MVLSFSLVFVVFKYSLYIFISVLVILVNQVKIKNNSNVAFEIVFYFSKQLCFFQTQYDILCT